MRNGTETRPNGVIITNVNHGISGKNPSYHIKGSINGPWDYIVNARNDADKLKPTLGINHE